MLAASSLILISSMDSLQHLGIVSAVVTFTVTANLTFSAKKDAFSGVTKNETVVKVVCQGVSNTSILSVQPKTFSSVVSHTYDS